MLHQNAHISIAIPIRSVTGLTTERRYLPDPSYLSNEACLVMIPNEGEHAEGAVEVYDQHTSEEPISILVVDDDDSFRRAFVDSLMELTNIEVITDQADTGENAIIKLRDEAKLFDVIFLDLVLPQMTGVETHDEITKLNMGSKIFLMTSDPETNEARLAVQRGFRIFDKNVLRAELGDILRGR